MSESLDTIHHTAIQVDNIEDAVNWYRKRYKCIIAYQDQSWAMIQFSNTYLALVLPKQHPYHIAITTEKLDLYGKPASHRDGTKSVYIKDNHNNTIEMLHIPSKHKFSL